MTTKNTGKRMVYDVDDTTGEIVYREATAAEVKQAEADAKASVDEHRATIQVQIARALAATDWWFIREAEGAKKMTAKQKAYRAALRDLHAKAETAKNPLSLEIPEPPTA